MKRGKGNNLHLSNRTEKAIIHVLKALADFTKRIFNGDTLHRLHSRLHKQHGYVTQYSNYNEHASIEYTSDYQQLSCNKVASMCDLMTQ